MVTVTVIVEGGVLPNPNVAAITLDNTAVLRQNLKKFFDKALHRDDISIVVVPSAGYTRAAEDFNKGKGDYLYTDLDKNPTKEDWFKNLEDYKAHPVIISDDKKDLVFFWIPEMEVWFLKQPQAIDNWCLWNSSQYKLIKSVLQDDFYTKKKIIAWNKLQQKPSFIMDVLFKHCIEDIRTKKAARYGKLRHAPHIIGFLDPLDLMTKDSELKNFIDKVNNDHK